MVPRKGGGVRKHAKWGMGQNSTTRGPQVLVHVSIFRGNPFWLLIFDPLPKGGKKLRTLLCMWPWVKSQIVPAVNIPIQPLK